LQKWASESLSLKVSKIHLLNPLKLKLIEIICKNSVCTSRKTLHFTIMKISWLMLLKEVIPVYTYIHTRPIKTKLTVTDCEAGGTCNFHWAVKS
jgi:hypothetical protein